MGLSQRYFVFHSFCLKKKTISAVVTEPEFLHGGFLLCEKLLSCALVDVRAVGRGAECAVTSLGWGCTSRSRLPRFSTLQCCKMCFQSLKQAARCFSQVGNITLLDAYALRHFQELCDSVH